MGEWGTATTWVVTGSPNGSIAATIILTWGAKSDRSCCAQTEAGYRHRQRDDQKPSTRTVGRFSA